MEILILCLFAGGLGYEAIIWGNWLQQQQQQQSQQEEEEEILTRYESYGQDPHIPHLPTSPTSSAPVSDSNGADSTDCTLEGWGTNSLPKDTSLMGWEYKIVRSHYDLFRDPAVFQKLCREEAEAGWLLLEKLDDRRVRFKRPVALRDILTASCLDHDPYRTHYGPSGQLMSWLGMVAAITAIVLPAYLGYALVTRTSTRQPAPFTFPSPTYPSPSLP
ncbi:MAG: hypothetical protein NZ772_15085 [Cyanobacteria bacterium]|nr:hypothetical protein [Cyanobacteriota bacterium]MDW8202206.1 hypothetical protein [Cyanobacteriota bacterium SKYGB_h_bin112]